MYIYIYVYSVHFIEVFKSCDLRFTFCKSKVLEGLSSLGISCGTVSSGSKFNFSRQNVIWRFRQVKAYASARRRMAAGAPDGSANYTISWPETSPYHGANSVRKWWSSGISPYSVPTLFRRSKQYLVDHKCPGDTAALVRLVPFDSIHLYVRCNMCVVLFANAKKCTHVPAGNWSGKSSSPVLLLDHFLYFSTVKKKTI